MTSTYSIAWWNVENLFDDENSPRRTDKVRRAIGKSIVGWTPQLRDAKIQQLASVIAQMNGGLGPDLMGVCEVENEYVVQALCVAISQRLGQRTYDYAHADCSDQRGIDIAFIFDRSLFTAPSSERFQHVVMRRTATREIFQVNFQTRRGRTFAVFGNHWPSRSGGEFETSGYRMIAGETLSYFHERVLEVHGADTPVLVMGDENDEPFSPSLVAHALSTGQRSRLASAQTPLLWNLMWPLLADADGSFWYQNQPSMFDQFLVNKNMAGDGPIRVKPETVRIVRFPHMARPGKFPCPINFGGMGKPVNTAGFSDHFPISVEVVEDD